MQLLIQIIFECFSHLFQSAKADAKSLNLLYDNLYVLPNMGYWILLILFGISLSICILLFIVLAFLRFSHHCRPQGLNPSHMNESPSDASGAVQNTNIEDQVEVSLIQIIKSFTGRKPQSHQRK